MSDFDYLTVPQAAAALGVTDDAVRKLLQAGRLAGIQQGRFWLIDGAALRSFQRQRPSPGRPLSQAVCWGAILSWSGWTAANDAGRHACARGSRWLVSHSLARNPSALRRRSTSERFRAHPAALERIAGAPHFLRSGPAAAGLSGLIGADEMVETYAPLGAREGTRRQYGLLDGRGNVLVRWIDDAVWSWVAPFTRSDWDPAAAPTDAPRAAALLDCLEHDDPRVRRLAGEALER